MKKNKQHYLSTVLKRLMTECNIDDAKLSETTGVPFTTIARMRSNIKANPTASSLRPLASYFGISISQLLGDEPLSTAHLLSENTTSRQIPLISWQRAAAWADDNDIKHKDICNWLSIDLPLSPKSFAVTIENRGFGQPFNAGNILIIDPSATPTSKDYVLLQLRAREEICLKEIIFDGDHTYLKSVNPELTQASPLSKDYKLIGVVIELRQRYHTDSFTKLKPTLESSFKLDQVECIE
jgi:SOS-response transcriptional repressor LexA